MAGKKQQKATKAPREKKAKAEGEMCVEETDEEEGEMATSGEQQNEEGHTAVAAKRRMAQPTKKARKPEFLGEPVPADEACANWPQRYQRASPMRYALDPSPIRLALTLLLPAPVGLMWTRLRA